MLIKDTRKEAAIQAEFFEKIKLLFPRLPEKLIFAVPNGGSRHIMEAANMKRQGIKAGVADVILLIPSKGFGSLCIEFKTSRGRQSPDQIKFQQEAEKHGNKYVIVRSVMEAVSAVKEYLK